MQISKSFPAVCAAAVCVSFITVRAEDTPAQAAARAALMEKMNALEAQPAQPAPPPIVVIPSGAMQEKPGQPTNMVVVPHPAVHARPAVRAPETKPLPSTEAVQTTPATSDADAQARARAALEQKMSELNQQNSAVPAVAPATPSAPQTQPVAISPVKPAPPAVKPEVVSRVNQFNGNYPGKELGLKPIQAPPLPISAAKQAQLQGLLDSYRADQITPEQYHTQRAKILAEP
jgi:hypothetical protein